MDMNFFEPRINADNKEYWDGCREHKLLAQKCAECGKLRTQASYFCPLCLGDKTEAVELSKKGVIYSYIRLEKPFHPSMKEKLPYIVAEIDLDEGIRILANMDEELENLKCGMKVEIDFYDCESYSKPLAKLVK